MTTRCAHLQWQLRKEEDGSRIADEGDDGDGRKRYSNQNHVRLEILSVIFAVIFYPLAGMRADERGNLFAHRILKLHDTILKLHDTISFYNIKSARYNVVIRYRS